MKFYLVFVISCLQSLFSSAWAAGPRTLNDSLVKDLACAALREDNVLLQLQPDAFSLARQLPVQNWASGHGLAECWSLSHTQRLLYYMGRFGTAMDWTAPANERYIPAILGLIEGAFDSHPFVFGLESISNLYSALESHLWQSSIERYEDHRFYEPGNLELLIGERDRSRRANAETYAEILSDLARGRLPIVIMRPSIAEQHAILIKASLRNEVSASTTFTVYDSNYPDRENSFTYDEREGEFYAPNVVGGFDANPNEPLGVFRVDSGEMERIEKALFQYYQGICQS
jgi:hypothetical protein